MTETKNDPRRWLTILVRTGLPLLVLAVGAAVAGRLIATAPKAERQPPPRQARLVEVQTVRFDTHRTVVPAMGTVQPTREVALQPRVSGQIVAVSEEFVPGGSFEEGQMLVRIDPTDFELAIRQRESEVAQAQTELALELGHQTVAQREFELLGETVREEDRALVLRQPHLERVRARLHAAQAALEQAKLDLERTTVRAPFNALVRSREVNVGMQVTASTTLATLTGTDAYWIEVTVPVDQLQWIEIPATGGGNGAAARVYNEAAWGAQLWREGRVIRLLSDLEKEGRMARLLVEVEDPLARESAHAGLPKLLLGEYVRVEIEGRELDRVAAVDRRLVREGNRVWVMNERDELEIRAVEIVFRGRDHLLVGNGLRDGERIVTTDLAAPVEGMPLRVREILAPPPAATETAP
jgi:RND family efflux transporter MFP subunit